MFQEYEKMEALHTLKWRVTQRELKALRESCPEIPLVTCLDEEDEPPARVPPAAPVAPPLQKKPRLLYQRPHQPH